jgi:hypothetical protein
MFAARCARGAEVAEDFFCFPLRRGKHRANQISLRTLRLCGEFFSQNFLEYNFRGLMTVLFFTARFARGAESAEDFFCFPLRRGKQ